MFNSWFHIRFLAKFFHENLINIVFEKPFTFKKEELNIPFLDNRYFKSFRFSTRMPLPMFTLEKNRPKPNQKVEVFKHLEGLQLENVKWHRNDRFMLFELSSGEYLMFQIFGPNGNVYYLDQDFQYKERFIEKGRKVIPKLSDFTFGQTIGISKNIFINIIRKNSEKSVTGLIKQDFPYSIYQNVLISEICFRAGIDSEELVANLDQHSINKFYEAVNTIFTEISNRTFHIYDNEPPVFAFFNLQSADEEPEKFNDIIRFTEQYVRYYFGWYNFSQSKKNLKSKLDKYQNLLERKIFKQSRSLENFPTPQDFRQKADTLLANQYDLEDHISQVTLPNIHDPSDILKIELDPELTIPENANKFYHKSKRVGNSKKELEKEYQENKKNLKKVNKYLAKIDKIEDRKKLKEIHRDIPERYLNTLSKQQNEKSRPYRYFTFRGWEILVGKSAQKNDDLTFGVANKNDFWLHAQKMTGSHVVVRNPEKKESLPEPVLRRAAGIAAHYSKGKNARAVPVIYTKKKYVWTSKKLPPGKVRYQYENMIVARPYDPTGH